MSVASAEKGYAEGCIRSHEFLRRACTLTPVSSYWAGDLLVTQEAILKQSEVNDMRGEEGAAEIIHTPPTEECGEQTVSMPENYTAEETSIRSEGAATFEYAVSKNEPYWDVDIYQSRDDCGVMMDGGDVVFRTDSNSQVASICGTIIRKAVGEPKAHYLDNRTSYSDDPDNGLLVAIRTGLAWNWEVRYAPKERNLTSGLIMSDDVTDKFMEQITALGMTQNDIIEFGMI